MKPINQTKTLSTIMLAMIMAAAITTNAQDTMHSFVRNQSEIKYIAFLGLPTCAQGAIESGNPATGPSFFISKVSKGCVIPWHWHTPNEYLIVISGAVTMNMKDEGSSMTMRAGDFAVMSSHHIHQLQCTQDCVLYVYSDAPFDIHYVDKQGKEISVDDALKAVNEATVSMPAKK